MAGAITGGAGENLVIAFQAHPRIRRLQAGHLWQFIVPDGQNWPGRACWPPCIRLRHCLYAARLPAGLEANFPGLVVLHGYHVHIIAQLARDLPVARTPDVGELAYSLFLHIRRTARRGRGLSLLPIFGCPACHASNTPLRLAGPLNDQALDFLYILLAKGLCVWRRLRCLCFRVNRLLLRVHRVPLILRSPGISGFLFVRWNLWLILRVSRTIAGILLPFITHKCCLPGRARLSPGLRPWITAFFTDIYARTIRELYMNIPPPSESGASTRLPAWAVSLITRECHG